MIRKILLLIAVSAVTMMLTTIYQPFSVVQSTARSQPGQEQSADTATCQRFDQPGQTGFQVCGRFLAYWYKYGGLKQFGYPLSDPFRERSAVNGEEYTVQYFERAEFELHPENQPPYDILLSQLGRLTYQQKYPSGTSGAEWTGDPQPDLNVSKPLRTGLDIKLIRAEQGAITGLYPNLCGLEMTWVLQIENKSSAPVVVELDKSNMRMLDSTGKSYSAIGNCSGGISNPYSGSFAQPVSMTAGYVLKGTIAFEARDIPQSATYFLLKVSFSGAPVEFRYVLP
jgi:hypothetical protein